MTKTLPTQAALSHAAIWYSNNPRAKADVWGASDGHLFLNKQAALAHCRHHKLIREVALITRAAAEAYKQKNMADAKQEAKAPVEAKAVKTEGNK